MAYSTDGKAWTAVDDVSSAFGTSQIRGIAWGNGKYAAVGDGGKIAYSTDGSSWIAVESNPFGSGNIYGIAWGAPNGKFVAVGAGGKIAYSTDAIAWTAVSGSPFLSDVTTVAFAGGKFIAGGGTSPGKLAYSSNGVTWALASAPTFSSSYGPGAAAYGAGLFIASVPPDYFSSMIAISTDGEGWTAANRQSNVSLGNAFYLNGRFFLLGWAGNTLALSEKLW